MKRSSFKLIPLFFSLFFLLAQKATAQLDSVHWIPPMFAEGADGVSYVYVSTPEKTPFNVLLEDMAGGLITTLTVSNASPVFYRVPNNLERMIVVTDNDETGIPLSKKGFKLRGGKKFYANYRVDAGQHAGSLTPKGMAAIGQVHRIGHLNTLGSASYNKTNFFGIIALENDTKIVVDGMLPGTVISGRTLPTGALTITLQKGQSYIGTCERSKNLSNPNALMGAQILSSKPVVVNCGSWLSSANASNADIGIDQIVPFERVGTEYIVIRGFGLERMENPIAIAHENGTQIFVNGSATPYTTLNAGEYSIIPSTYYGTTGNMYISSNKPIFMYQQLGGSDSYATAALNFLPPLSCQIGNTIDNIPDVNLIGTNATESGGVFIIAFKNSTTKLFQNGAPLALPTPKSVMGKPDYVTYLIEDLVGDIKVVSDAPVQVGILNKDGAAGWGGYFSGFSKERLPSVTLGTNRSLQLTAKPCPDTLFAFTKYVSEIKWYLDGVLLPTANDTVVPISKNGVYRVVGKLRSICDEEVYDTAFITIGHFWGVEAKPQAATCNGSNGSVTIDLKNTSELMYYALNGGAPQTVPHFDNLPKGIYRIVVTPISGVGCSQTLTVTVDGLSLPKVQSPQISPEYCDKKNGGIALNMAGGVSPYRYSLNGSALQPSNLFSNLPAGTYFISGVDSVNCPFYDTLVVPHVEARTPVLTGVEPACEGGTRTVQLSQPQTYQQVRWSTGAQTPAVVLPAGSYTVTTIDEHQCAASVTFDIGVIALFNRKLTAPQSVCKGSSAQVGLQISSPDARGWAWFSSISGPSGALPIQGGTATWQVAPEYSGNVRIDSIQLDGYNCPFKGDTAALIQVISIQANLHTTPISCYGDANGSIKVAPSEGTSPYTYQWGHDPALQQPLAQKLGPGDYSVTIRDQDGCTAVAATTLEHPPQFLPTTTTFAPPCDGINNGFIEVSGLSGAQGRVIALLNGNPFSAPGRKEDLAPGRYTLYMYDEMGCEFEENYVFIAPPKYQIALDTVQVFQGDPYRPLIKGTYPYPDSIRWFPDSLFSQPDILRPVIETSLHTTPIKVWMRTKHGCPLTAEGLLKVDETRFVYTPNVFMPGSQLGNDYFNLYPKEGTVKQVQSLRVFDRWGSLVYLFCEENGDLIGPGWNGTCNGELCQEGVYIWFGVLKFIDGETRLYQGDVTLLREFIEKK